MISPKSLFASTMVIKEGHIKKEDKEMDKNYSHSGQGLVEYAFIMLLVAIVVIVILALLGPTVGNLYSSIVVGL